MSQRPAGEIRLTPKAEADLDNIGDYWAESQSEDYAESYLLKLALQLELLLSQPMMGRSAQKIQSELRRFPFQKHVVFYRSIQQGIEAEVQSHFFFIEE